MSGFWASPSFAGSNVQSIAGFLDYFGKAVWKRQPVAPLSR